jgi:hypothetical protein
MLLNYSYMTFRWTEEPLSLDGKTNPTKRHYPEDLNRLLKYISLVTSPEVQNRKHQSPGYTTGPKLYQFYSISFINYRQVTTFLTNVRC